MNEPPVFNEVNSFKESYIYKRIEETKRFIRSLLYLTKKIFML